MRVLLLGIKKNESLIEDFYNEEIVSTFISCNTMFEAKELLAKYPNMKVVIVDTNAFEKEILSLLPKMTDGLIIGKVKDETAGMELVKEKIINDYFVPNSQISSFLKCIKNINNKLNIRQSILEIKEDLATLSSLAEPKK